MSVVDLLPKQKKNARNKIPTYLIRDEINGVCFYYRNYKNALKNEKTINEIMGSSAIQSLIIEYMLEVIYASEIRKLYRVFTNESGNNLSLGTNMSFDIALYDRTKLTADNISNKYVKNTPPNIVIEVDTDVSLDGTGFESIESYYFMKTKKLLEYGTKKVIWIFTESRKILIAEDKTWQIFDFDDTLQLVDNVSFNISNFLKREGVTLI